MAKIFGQLEKAQLENTTSDTGSLPKGMATYRTDLNVAKVSNGTTMIEVVDASTAQTLTNKTLTSPTLTTPNTEVIGLDGQASTPSTPAAGFYKAYVKDSTGKLTVLNSAGTETTVGGGGSSGINYILNPDAETDTTGWVLYEDTAGVAPVDGTGVVTSNEITFTRTTSSPLRSVASFLITKDAANRQGEGVGYAFTIDPADRGKVLQGSFDYASSGTFADNDISVWIYDVTNSVLIQPAPYLLKNHTLAAERFPFEFQTASNSTSYRLIFHVASTSALAYTVKLDNVSIGPAAKLYGSPVTDWQSYTLVIGATTTAPTPATVVRNQARWRRVGDSMEIRYSFYAATPAGTAGTGTYLFPLPAGYSMDTSKIYVDTDRNTGTAVGPAMGYSSTLGPVEGSVYAASAGALAISLGDDANAPFAVGSTTMPLSTVETTWTFTATVPITGWSSSVIMSSDANTSVSACYAYRNGNTTFNANAARQQVLIDTVLTDTQAMLSGNTIVIKTSGYYDLYATALWTGGNMVSGGTYEIMITQTTVNGTILAVSDQRCQASGAFVTTHCRRDAAYLQAGTVLCLGLYSNQNHSVNTVTIDGSFHNWTHISVKQAQGPAQIAASETVAAIISASGSTTIAASGVDTKIAYNTVVRDTHGAFNTSTNTYTAPMSGFYNVKALMRFDTLAWSVQSRHDMLVYVNGSALKYLDSKLMPTTGTYYPGSLGGPANIYLNAGDTVSVYARHQEVGTRATIVDATINQFEIERAN
jgi:hypothetical protein